MEVAPGAEEEEEEEEGAAAAAAAGICAANGACGLPTAISPGTSSCLARPLFSFCQVTEIPRAGGAGGISCSSATLWVDWATGADRGGGGGGGTGCGAVGIGGGAGDAVRGGGGGIGGGPVAAAAAGCGKGAPQDRQNFAASAACCPHFGQNFISRICAAVSHNRRRSGRWVNWRGRRTYISALSAFVFLPTTMVEEAAVAAGLRVRSNNSVSEAFTQFSNFLFQTRLDHEISSLSSISSRRD